MEEGNTQPQVINPQPQVSQPSKYNTLAIIAFIFAILVSPVGFILGIIALSQIKKTNEKGKGLAIAAIVIGAIFFVFLILMVFVGLAWIGIRNTVYEGNESPIDINDKCLSTDIEPTKVVKNSETDYLVTLRRNSGEDEIGGVEVVFTDEEGIESYIIEVPGNIETLMEKTASASIPMGTLPNPNKVAVVVYFLSDSGEQQICQTATQLRF